MLPHTGVEDQARVDARLAGDSPLGAYDKCMGCPGALHGQACDMCRDNPEPDPDREIDRILTWLSATLNIIDVADLDRRRSGRPIDEAMRVRCAVALSDIIDDVGRLETLLSGPVVRWEYIDDGIADGHAVVRDDDGKAVLHVTTDGWWWVKRHDGNWTSGIAVTGNMVSAKASCIDYAREHKLYMFAEPDAEEIAGELSVKHVIKEGGQ